jgi:hypothetical protein
MKIVDTIPFFINHYQSTIDFLKDYYNEFPDVFKEYFAYHCKDTEERLSQAIEKYPHTLNKIEDVHKIIKPIIQEVSEAYFRLYHVSFPVDINLIVGGFGSNAYTHRQIIPNITFALEKLSPVSHHLKTIVAHEFGHATHNIISNETGMDWDNVQWNHPLTWLNQEGAAIHFSKKVVPNMEPSTYFSFDDDGQDWLLFATEHLQEIKTAFAKDFNTKTPQALFREWFSIHGGETFGYSRLAYFLGDIFFQHQIKRLGEIDAIVAWKHPGFIEQAESWLKQES